MSCSASRKSTKVHCVTRSILGSEIKYTKSAGATCCINQLGEELSLVQPSPPTPTNLYTIVQIPPTRHQIVDYMSAIRNERKRESSLTVHKQKMRDGRLCLQEGAIMH